MKLRVFPSIYCRVATGVFVRDNLELDCIVLSRVFPCEEWGVLVPIQGHGICFQNGTAFTI